MAVMAAIAARNRRRMQLLRAKRRARDTQNARLSRYFQATRFDSNNPNAVMRRVRLQRDYRNRQY